MKRPPLQSSFLISRILQATCSIHQGVVQFLSLFCKVRPSCTVQFQNHTCTFSNKSPQTHQPAFNKPCWRGKFSNSWWTWIHSSKSGKEQHLLLATSHPRVQCIGKRWHESCEKARRLCCLFKTRTLGITMGCAVPNRASMTWRCVCVYEGHSPAQWDEIQCVNGSLFLSSPLGVRLMSEGQDVSRCSLWLLIWC